VDISKVAKLSVVPASALRFYEEKGLIHSIGRHGLKRIFAPSVIDRLALIALGQRAGLSLDEIGQMLTKKGADIDRELLMKKANKFDQKIRELTAMRDGLRHAAKCTAPNHFECPKFMRLVGLAARKRKITI